MYALRCENLSRVFGRKKVLNDVSLALLPGEVYGLVGRNGAGKSTLLKILAGYLAPSAGSVEVWGEAMGPCRTSARLGCLIEHPSVNPALTGMQNVMMRAIAQGDPNPEEACRAALSAVGLEARADERAGGYSVGMKQRLGLALALVGAPDVLLLDEPFNGLDPEGVKQVRQLLVELAHRRNCAVVVSSHVLDQLERMVNRYGVISEGRLVAQMTAREVEEACAECLYLKTPDAAWALVVLQRALPGASFAVMPDDAIRVEGAVESGEVGRALLAADVPVSSLYVHSRDIEDYFVGLMGGSGPVRGKAADADGNKGGDRDD